MLAGGTVEKAAADAEIADIARRCADAGIVSVAVCLLNAYRNGANSYITKHPDFDRFLNSIQLLIGYWRDAVQLPRVGA